jgi:hypothetical protein
MTGKVKGKLGGVAGSILERSNYEIPNRLSTYSQPLSLLQQGVQLKEYQSSYLTISDSSRTQVTQAPIKIPRTSYAKTLKKVSQ